MQRLTRPLNRDDLFTWGFTAVFFFALFVKLLVLLTAGTYTPPRHTFTYLHWYVLIAKRCLLRALSQLQRRQLLKSMRRRVLTCGAYSAVYLRDISKFLATKVFAP